MTELDIGSNLTAIMKALGVSQKQLARTTGLSQSRISELQHNIKPDIRVSTLVKLADALYCTTDVLLGR